MHQTACYSPYSPPKSGAQQHNIWWVRVQAVLLIARSPAQELRPYSNQGRFLFNYGYELWYLSEGQTAQLVHLLLPYDDDFKIDDIQQRWMLWAQDWLTDNLTAGRGAMRCRQQASGSTACGNSRKQENGREIRMLGGGTWVGEEILDGWVWQHSSGGNQADKATKGQWQNEDR